MRSEIELTLQNKGLEYFKLPLCARILLVTDGTVTELLEALVREPIALGYKAQEIKKIDNASEFKSFTNNDWLHRNITLRGTHSGTDWIYAESIIDHQGLNSEARKMLVEENIPIGTILSQTYSDNHRKLIDCGIRKYAAAAVHLSLNPDYEFVFRNYQIMVGTNPIMNITEWFPVSIIGDQITD